MTTITIPRTLIHPILGLALLFVLTGCDTLNSRDGQGGKQKPQKGFLELPNGKRIGILPSNLIYTGDGTYTWPDGRQQSGAWLDGQLQGMGTETTGHDSYTGQWRQGQRHGHGELENNLGRRYVGDFVSGLAEGKGTQTSKQGVYRGTWRAGKRDGQGQFNSADGAIYQGQWQADKRSGFGQESYANGDTYVGEWQADKPHGFGQFETANGTTYEGQWAQGRRDGYGAATGAANIVYEGTWRADQQHGFGKQTLPDKSVFTGQWRAGKRHGEGQEIYADGRSHKGMWVDDKISGTGQRTDRAGIVVSGQWQQNEIVSGNMLLPSGANYSGALFGENGRRITPELINWLSQQASAKDQHAQYFLGSAYLDFDEPPTDPNTAKIWLKRAAQAGVAEAQFRLSRLIIDEDVDAGLQWLQHAAAQQHAGANESLGEYFHTGQYLPKNYLAAVDHYQHAVTRGSIVATNNLAWLLATCEDANVADPQRAIELIQPYVLYLGNWQHLDTLAAAYARQGQIELAERMQNQALIQAQSLAAEQVIAEMSARLTLYQNKQAYIE